MAINIRPIQAHEFSFLEEMLYEAIFIPEGKERPPISIVKLPELACYYENFGRKHDICFLAANNSELIAAIWIRLFTVHRKGYGYVDDNTPELCMSVKPPYRNNGIGTQLMKLMLEELVKCEYEKVSLSVDKINYALKMYEKFGFKFHSETDDSYTLVKQLIEKT